MPENDVYQVNVQHIIAGKETSNVFYYRQGIGTEANPLVTARAICVDFYDGIWVPTWQDLLSDDARLVSIWSRRLWPVLESGSTVLYANEPGAIAGDAVPNGAAVLISTSSTNPTRNFQRRTYISGLPERDSAESKLTVPAQSNWVVLANAFVQYIIRVGPTGVATFTATAFSKSLALEAGPQPWRDLTSFRLTPHLRSQRQRNPRSR